MLAGSPAAAFDQVAAAGGESAQIMDMVRAVTGGAGRKRLAVTDMSLRYMFLHLDVATA